MLMDKETVKKQLKEYLTLLCQKNMELTAEFSIEALVGITVNKEDILLISINETISSARVKDHVVVDKPADPPANASCEEPYSSAITSSDTKPGQEEESPKGSRRRKLKRRPVRCSAGPPIAKQPRFDFEPIEIKPEPLDNPREQVCDFPHSSNITPDVPEMTLPIWRPQPEFWTDSFLDKMKDCVLLHPGPVVLCRGPGVARKAKKEQILETFRRMELEGIGRALEIEMYSSTSTFFVKFNPEHLHRGGAQQLSSAVNFEQFKVKFQEPNRYISKLEQRSVAAILGAILRHMGQEFMNTVKRTIVDAQ